MSDLQRMLDSVPLGLLSANRYDTDDEHVLSLWADGKTTDIRWPRWTQTESRCSLCGAAITQRWDGDEWVDAAGHSIPGEHDGQLHAPEAALEEPTP